MKVLHVFKTYVPQTAGGIEQVIYQLAEGCHDHGIRSEVLFLSREGAARDISLSKHRYHQSKLDLYLNSTGLSLGAFRDFRELSRGADLIHYHFPWPFMDVLHLTSATDKPSLLTYHSDIIKQKVLYRLYRPLMKRFLDSVDLIVASSPNYLETSRVLQDYAAKVRVIPFGLDQHSYPAPAPERLAYWRARAPARFFLFIGALRYYKGLEHLLRAAQDCPAPILIAGCGPMDAKLRAMAAKGTLANVSFLGAVSEADKIALLSLCKAVLLPSHLRSEAFGISLVEGAMFGKPLLTCEIGTGTSFVNRADETGLVVPPGDIAALTRALRILWEQPAVAEAMGQKARLRYEQLFSHERMATAYAAAYQDVLLDRS